MKANMRFARRSLIVLTLSLAANAFAASTLTGQTPVRQSVVTIANVTVVDVRNGRLLPDQTVVVTDGRIAAVSPAPDAQIPAGSAVIDGTARFLIPGLWEMHAHVVSSTLGLYIANGVTGVREMGTSLQSIDQNVALRQRIADGDVIGPRYVVGVTINNRAGSRNVVGAATAEAGRAAVDSLRRAGADFIKVYDGLSRETYLAIAAEARRQGIPFAGHVPGSVTLEEAARAGQRSFEHLVPFMPVVCSSRSAELGEAVAEAERLMSRSGPPDSLARAQLRSTMLLAVETYDEDRCRTEARRLAGLGGWHTPTLMAGMRRPQVHNDSVLQDPRLAYVPESLQRQWEQARSMYVSTYSESDTRNIYNNLLLRIVSVLHRENIGLLAGTDAPGVPWVYAGFSLHEELEHLVRAGLTPVEALRAATMEPARYLGLEDSIGVVEEGKLADLVLLDANPLEDITNTRRVYGVVSNGWYFDRAALDTLLEQARGGPAR